MAPKHASGRPTTKQPQEGNSLQGEGGKAPVPPFREDIGKGKANDGRDEQGQHITEADDPGLDPTEPTDGDRNSPPKR